MLMTEKVAHESPTNRTVGQMNNTTDCIPKLSFESSILADSDLSALNKVRRLLGARGLTITDMAGAVGKSRPAIYRVLKDEEHYPHTPEGRGGVPGRGSRGPLAAR